MSKNNNKDSIFYVEPHLLPYVITLIQWESPNNQIIYQNKICQLDQLSINDSEKILIINSEEIFLKYKEYGSKTFTTSIKIRDKYKLKAISWVHIIYKIIQLYGSGDIKLQEMIKLFPEKPSNFQQCLLYVLSNKKYRNNKYKKSIFKPISYFYYGNFRNSLTNRIWNRFIKTSNPYYSTYYHLLKEIS